MMEVSETKENENRLLVLWIIWGGIFGFLFIYALVCHLWGVKIQQNMGPNFPLDLMRNVLYGVAISTLILTHFLRKFLLAGRSSGSTSMSLNPPAPSSQASPNGKYAVAMLLSLALSESIGVYGLVLFLVGESFRTLYIFLGISALAMFLYRPKREELESLAMAESRSALNM